MIIGASLTKREIKELCGSTSYTRGQNYQLMRKVRKLDYDPNEFKYEAIVKGSRSYRVAVIIDEHTMNVEAECDCPAYGTMFTYCKHIAAVLLEIEELNRLRATMRRSSGSGRTSAVPAARSGNTAGLTIEEKIISENVLSLFNASGQAIDASSANGQIEGTEAKVEFIVQIKTGYRAAAAVELKVGTARTYVVQKIRDFLMNLSTGQPHFFTKMFTFDPVLHQIRQQDAKTLKLLQDICSIERSYKERGSYYYQSAGADRELYIPPVFWNSLNELLEETETVYFVDGQACERLEWQDGPPPLAFRLEKGRTKQDYWLSAEGVGELAPLPSYGFVMTKSGQLYKMDAALIERLERLKSIISSTVKGKVAIPSDRLDAYVNQVLPELGKWGKLTVDQSIQDIIISEPLQSRVYLDYRDGQLCAKVEFHYGDHIIPSTGRETGSATGGMIIMRQKNEEAVVLQLLRQSGFREGIGELKLVSEQEQYTFMYSRLAALQEIADVYATNAVKGLQSTRNVIPKTSIEMDESVDWLEVKFDMEGVERRDLLRLLQSIREKRPYHRLSDGAFVSLEEKAFQDIGHLFEELGITKAELTGERIQLPVVRGLSLADADASELGHVRLDKAFKRLLNNLKNPENLEFEPPMTLSSTLRDYQYTGFQWMKTLSYYGFGGILADDMGLGKTLQSIAYLASEREQARSGAKLDPSLIVCPASLVYNWKQELVRFAPGLKTAVVSGARSDREAALELADQVDVFITSYPLLRRDADLYDNQRFHCLILDEAQAIKNHATQTAQLVKGITAARRFALTGTPVENRLEELWSIYDAVFPELFAGRKSFSDLTPEQVSRKIRPFIMRRLKKDVLTELPDKIETLQTSELVDEQKKLYMAYLMQLKEETAQQLQEEGFQKSRMKILAGLTRLRQICCHPSLFVEDYGGKSGKLEQLMELIEEYSAVGRRMLVFSQFTGMLSIMREKLDSRQRSYFYLDGATKSSERVEFCRRFNAGERDMFLISLKAGGTGLNLTGADTVILYDLWWNPAVEQQAADRAHRMGQKNVVQVIRMMTEGTIEEKMYELQQQKRDLIDKVVQPGEQQLSSLTEQDIRELLAL